MSVFNSTNICFVCILFFGLALVFILGGFTQELNLSKLLGYLTSYLLG